MNSKENKVFLENESGEILDITEKEKIAKILKAVHIIEKEGYKTFKDFSKDIGAVNWYMSEDLFNEAIDYINKRDNKESEANYILARECLNELISEDWSDEFFYKSKAINSKITFESYKRYVNENKKEFVLKNKLINLLKNPNLFNDITLNEFDKKIVGEIASRKVIFLCAAGGRLVKNCQVASYNVLVNDEAGTGKDYVTGKVLSILPKEVYIHKTRISPTVFTYWHNSQYEPEWSWDGKVFYPEDISETVLNSDVFKVMCSSGSSATITIKNRAIDIEIIGKPVMITTTATATPNPELVRRFVILNLDSSEEQTKAIMKRHCEYAQTGIIPEYNKDYTEALKILKKVNVKIPYAKILSEVLPSKSIIMRTHLPRFLDYIKASCAFYQFQREIEEDFILANGQDYDLARECFLKLCSNKYMIPLTINQKKILEAFSKNPSRKYSVTQFHAENNFMSVTALQTNLGLLAKYSILQTSTDKDTYGRDLEVYQLSRDSNPNDRFDIPTYADLLKHLKQVEHLKQVKQVEQGGDVKDIKDIKAEKCLHLSEKQLDFEELKAQYETEGLL